MTNASKSFRGFLAALTGSLLVTAAFHYTLLAKDSPPAIKQETSPINRDAKLGTSFAPVIKKAAPSVVTIYSSRTVKVQPRRNPFQNDPMFRQFFGNQFNDDDSGRARTRKESGLGSGVIISPDGYILTANHVVDGMDEIKVAINGDKKQYVAKVIGKDKPTDIAVLKIEANGLPAITLADSEQLEIGDIVLAIGNPFGVGQTVTMGIVSALGRSGFGINGVDGYENFIQTDAAINPGNSGGALVDAEGRLVGINTAIITRTGSYQGVGFAVPINMAYQVMERLISGGTVSRGYLGILPQDIDAGLAKQFNLPDQNGTLVGDVFPDTPALKAGLKPGDIIVAFNGKSIADAHSLQLAVSQCLPGTPATVKFIRDGKPKTLTLTLGDLKQARGGSGDSSDDNSTTDALDGVGVDNLDADIRQELKIPDNIKGVLVSDVEADSNAAEAGLQKGDVIIEINRQPVTDTDQAIQLCKDAKGDQIVLRVWRRLGDMAGTRYISVDNTKHTADKDDSNN